MQILQIFGGGFALFLVVRLFFLPRAQRAVSVEVAARPHKVAKAAAIQTFSNLLFWFAMSAGIAGLGVYYTEQLNPKDLSQAESILATVRHWTEWLEAISDSVALFAAIAAALGLLLISYRRTKRVEAASLDARIEAKTAALNQEAQKGALDPLPSTDGMRKIEREIQDQKKKLESLEDADTPQDQKDALNAYVGQLHILLRQLDLARRAQSQVEEEIGESADQIPKRRLATFFVSNGFHDTLGALGKILAILCVLAIVPGSLVITGPLALDRLDEKRVALEEDRRDFQFAAARGEINQAWEGLTQSPETADLTEEDEQIANALGEAFESQAIPSSFARATSRVAGQSVIRAYQIERARSAILSNTAGRSSTLSVASPPTTDAQTQQIEALIARLADGQGVPQTAPGQQVRSEALTMARRNPEVWAGIRSSFQAYLASFGATASPARLQAIVVNQAVGDILGAVESGNSFWANQARSFGANISAETANAYSEAVARSFLFDFAKSGDLAASADRAAARSVTALASSDIAALSRVVEPVLDAAELTNAIRARRETLTARTLSISDNAAERAVERAAASIGSNMNAAGMLVEFADFFPGFEGQDLDTQRARVARATNLEGAPPSRARATPADLRQSRVAVVRAGSFDRLRGFSRVGGVLIGRDAEAGESLIVDDFAWQVRDGAFSFDLAVEGQAAKSFGPFDAAIAHLALAYAADGRATTVSMVGANSMLELRILLHPTLVDTGLGCRARRLDQFVDETTDDNDNRDLQKLRNKVTQNAVGEIALYNFARDVQLYTLSQTPSGRSQLASHDISDWADLAKQDTADLDEADSATLRLADKSMPLVIATKKEFFDATITNHVRQCRSVDDLDAFSNCVAERAKTQSSSTQSLGTNWFSPKIQFQPWSGVRERPFTVEDDLSFLTGTDETKSSPLRFMVQLAISSPAYFADPTKDWFDKNNEAVQNFTDLNPWEFKELEPSLNQAIAELLDESFEHADVYQDMLEFTTLQRFFRVALDGPLSGTFPIEELPKIADATLNAVNPDAPTLRWNVSPGQIERSMFELLNDVSSPDASLEACIRLADRPDAARVSPADWDTACGSSIIDRALSAEEKDVAQYLTELRVLRLDLGVTHDDELAQQYQQHGCPKP